MVCQSETETFIAETYYLLRVNDVFVAYQYQVICIKQTFVAVLQHCPEAFDNAVLG
jgi:hypothetical protein